jgi:hypothetical protein
VVEKQAEVSLIVRLQEDIETMRANREELLK